MGPGPRREDTEFGALSVVSAPMDDPRGKGKLEPDHHRSPSL